MDQNLFLESCDKVLRREIIREGIGTLSEKTLHAVLKNYFEPNTEFHERRVGRQVADIQNEHGIIEIQTKQFNRLRNKLTNFLEKYEVTVVYPIADTKYLYWVNEETGEISKGRKSPKRGSIYQIMPELYKIKSYLTHPNLSFCITMINWEEYRMLNGWSKDRKKGSSCNDRIPTELTSQLYLRNTEDYIQFIPEGLPKQFISRDFAKQAKIHLSLAQVTLNILSEVELVRKVGKSSRSILYEIVE